MRRAPSEPAPAWRLLLEPDGDGAANMAADEALLDAYLTPDGVDKPPTLRLYGWNPPTLSLGKGQVAERSHDPDYLEAAGLGLVRRPTGGQAVLHEGERTYCLAGRLDRPPFDGGVLSTYAAVAAALRSALQALGLETTAAPQRAPRANAPGPVCFNVASGHEPLHEGRKLIGSAQMRRRNAFLQHGSIPLHVDSQRLSAAIGAPADPGRVAGLADSLGRGLSFAELDAALIEGFERCFGIEFAAGERTPWERRRSEALRCWKYLSASWTYRGRIGPAERAHAPAGLFGPSLRESVDSS